MSHTRGPGIKGLRAGTVPEVVLTNGEELNFEKVAALQPDPIVGVYSDITEDDYQRLTAIAPTVAWAPDVAAPFASQRAVAFSGTTAPSPLRVDRRAREVAHRPGLPVGCRNRRGRRRQVLHHTVGGACSPDRRRPGFFIGDAADRAALEADPMFTSLPIYREGRVTFLRRPEDPPVGAALSQSTILSLPYAIDQVS
ncbi:hypothetical protein EEB14_17300 [Rhodococcus sp. WS4]|nr:hypothetical protein EEB14_17300 [Rhodococcus sp. WS4]